MSKGKTTGERKAKKPYRRPRLVAHGTLRELSQAGPKGGAASDGGGAPKTKASGKG